MTRRIEVVTQHAKERTLALPFLWGWGAQLEASSGVDTDLLGTFCGLQERQGTPQQAVAAKLDLGKARWRLASEASFGPDNVTGLLPSHHEILALRDQERGLTWMEEEVTLNTNFCGQRCQEWSQVEALAGRAGFPFNGLMVLGETPRKGICDWGSLRDAWKENGPCLLQTDMRNHLNQPRRFHLRRLGLKLVRRLRTLCPECRSPGFGSCDVQRGLPCALCGCPTAWVAQRIFHCQVCSYREARPREDGLTHCEPGNCEVCNP